MTNIEAVVTLNWQYLEPDLKTLARGMPKGIVHVIPEKRKHQTPGCQCVVENFLLSISFRLLPFLNTSDGN